MSSNVANKYCFSSSNLTKYDAYRHIADNYDDAVRILKEKHLALGEPAVVSFYYPSKDDDNRQIMTMLGIGSMNGETETISRISNDSSTIIYNLQKKIDSIIEHTSKISISLSPSVIFSNTETIVNVSAYVDTSGEVNEMTVYKNSEAITKTTDASLSYDFTANESIDCEISVDCSINDFSVRKSSILNVVDPIYYGIGNSYEDANITADPKTSPAGHYILNVSGTDKHVIFNVPSYMEIKDATVNSISIQMLDPEDVYIYGNQYKSYKSANTYSTGTIIVVIT